MNYKKIIIGCFIILVCNIYLARLSVTSAEVDVLCNTENKLVYIKGEEEINLTTCYPEFKDYVVLPSGERILFATGFPEPSRLLVYNIINKKAYEISALTN